MQKQNQVQYLSESFPCVLKLMCLNVQQYENEVCLNDMKSIRKELHLFTKMLKIYKKYIIMPLTLGAMCTILKTRQHNLFTDVMYIRGI